MKRRAGLALYLPLLLVTGCKEVTLPESGEEAWHAVQLDSRVTQAYTDFGFNLFHTLVAAEPGENLFISPTSAAFALAMTYNGAAGDTREAMAKTLGIDGLALEEVNRANREWLAALRDTQDRRVELALANSIWAREGFPFRPEFFDRNRQFYDAEVRELPFDAAAVKTINDWVSTHTRGRIPEIVEAIPGNVVMYLINALYFKGEWKFRFDRAETRNQPFHAADGSRPVVPMMHQRATFPYLWSNDFQMVSLPYGNGRFSMVLVLPHHNTDLSTFYGRLTPERWAQWTAELREGEVMVELPRFRVEWSDTLNDALKKLGMGVAFDGHRADFSEMSPARGLFITKVLQKTFVEVNEEGTEAAAVTKVAMGRVSGPPVVRFDRPFFFAIRDEATGTLLFLGHIADPAAG